MSCQRDTVARIMAVMGLLAGARLAIAITLPEVTVGIEGDDVVLVWEAESLNPGSSTELFPGAQLEASDDLKTWVPQGEPVETRIGGGSSRHEERFSVVDSPGYFRRRLDFDLLVSMHLFHKWNRDYPERAAHLGMVMIRNEAGETVYRNIVTLPALGESEPLPVEPDFLVILPVGRYRVEVFASDNDPFNPNERIDSSDRVDGLTPCEDIFLVPEPRDPDA